MNECYCDYGEQATIYRSVFRKARVQHKCYECSKTINPGERYEKVVTLYDGDWTSANTCCRCLEVREYVTSHAPCFCWMHGSMLDDAKNVIEQYGHESAGFFIGAMKRILRVERFKS